MPPPVRPALKESRREAVVSCKMQALPQPSRPARWDADPALIVIALFTAVSALMTLPPLTAARPASRPAPPPLVELRADETLAIDGVSIGRDRIVGRLTRALENRGSATVRFDAADEASWASASLAFQLIRDAGGEPRPITRCIAPDELSGKVLP
jgi:biopolymer transport protein ExbD